MVHRSFLERRLTAGVFQPVDKSPAGVEESTELLKLVAKLIPTMRLLCPMYGRHDRVGYNVDKCSVAGRKRVTATNGHQLKVEKFRKCNVFPSMLRKVFATDMWICW